MLAVGVFFYIADTAVFHPNHDENSRIYMAARSGFETVEFASNNRIIHGMLRRNTGSESSPLVIFFYGNAQNAAGTMRAMDEFGIWPYFLDYHCLIVDYPGYGPDSRGRPSVKNIYETALAAYDYARTLPGVSRIIAGGFSLGTGPAAYLAAHRNLDGLFLLSPFANTYDLYNNVLPVFYGPMRLFIRHSFRSDQHAQNITAPALLVASLSDEIIPFESSERLSGSFSGQTVFVTLSGVSHGSILFNRTALDSVKAYLQMLESQTPDP